jgi:hypothetical protein
MTVINLMPIYPKDTSWFLRDKDTSFVLLTESSLRAIRSSLRVSKFSIRVSKSSLRVIGSLLRVTKSLLRAIKSSLRVTKSSLRVIKSSLRVTKSSLRVIRSLLRVTKSPKFGRPDPIFVNIDFYSQLTPNNLAKKVHLWAFFVL